MDGPPGPPRPSGPPQGRGGRALGFGALGFGAVSLGLIGARAFGPVGGIVVAGGGALALAGFVFAVRQGVDAQVRASVHRGRVAVDAHLDFASLPGDWAQRARETLNPAAVTTQPALPVRLTVRNGAVHIDKKESWGAGRSPFHAAVALDEIVAVRVEAPRRLLAGTGLVLELRDGTTVDFDLVASREAVEDVAELLRRQHAPRPSSPSTPRPRPLVASRPSPRLVVDSPDPPVRTPVQQAALLRLAVLPPFVLGMVGFRDGRVAGFAALGLLLYVIGLELARPPSMARQVGVGLVVVAAGFAVDAVTTAQLWRVVGVGVCLALAVVVARRAAR